jgi:hypothetical protein
MVYPFVAFCGTGSEAGDIVNCGVYCCASVPAVRAAAARVLSIFGIMKQGVLDRGGVRAYQGRHEPYLHHYLLHYLLLNFSGPVVFVYIP